MKYSITSRYTGEVLVTVDIDCDEECLTSVKLGMAAIAAVRQGSDLQGANLQGANLQGANLRGAKLQDAKLQGAYM